jgi:hypothetical protein
VVKAEVKLVVNQLSFDLVNGLSGRVLIGIGAVGLESREDRVGVANIESDKR